MNTSEIFLVAMVLIFALPYLVWRLGRTEYFAPLVVVQIVTGIVLGLGMAFMIQGIEMMATNWLMAAIGLTMPNAP